jgi:uncharacterized protein (DUF4415 family)
MHRAGLSHYDEKKNIMEVSRVAEEKVKQERRKHVALLLSHDVYEMNKQFQKAGWQTRHRHNSCIQLYHAISLKC